MYVLTSASACAKSHPVSTWYATIVITAATLCRFIDFSITFHFLSCIQILQKFFIVHKILPADPNVHDSAL